MPMSHVEWHGQWNKNEHDEAHFEYEQGDHSVTFTGGQFLEASKSFPSRTTALDGISPKHFAYLSEAGLNGMAKVTTRTYNDGETPGPDDHFARVIPKPPADRRPIILFRSCPRAVNKTMNVLSPA